MLERMASDDKRAALPSALQDAGGLVPGAAGRVGRALGVPAAHAYGVGSFFHLLREPEVELRVCQGLSCQLRGSEALLQTARETGIAAAGCQCLAACDRPVAALRGRAVIPSFAPAARPSEPEAWRGHVGPEGSDPAHRAIDLLGAPDFSGAARARARALGPTALFDLLEESGLQGRGGAGFPAHLKWRAVAGQAETTRYVVLNADEGEPGTFKDREVLLRRPDLVLEGLLIAAEAVGAQTIACYLRGEFQGPWRALEAAVARFGVEDRVHLHAGHGAYICGEETALLEALEGKRGMPRLKPPFPTEVGLWGKPTLVHNVETLACVPGIVARGGRWFRGLGRTGAGTKLYCVSGHVRRPGTYELPLGICLDELLEAAGGVEGELKAFSPGGASSGFLPASERTRPLDFKALAEVGSMLGSAGVVVLNQTVSMPWAVRQQLLFFEAESCGQCAPCRIGTRTLRESLDRGVARDLARVAEVAWEMNEGSICGLGQAAPLPLTSCLKHFPAVFGAR